MDFFTVLLFLLPLIPLVHATIQDWKDKEIDPIIIASVFLLGLTFKAIYFPESIVSSAVFALFALSIGVVISEFKGWKEADALMMGAIGMCVLPVDYFQFFFISIVTLVVLNVMFKLRWRKKGGLEMDGIYTILLTYLAYSFVTLLVI